MDALAVIRRVAGRRKLPRACTGKVRSCACLSCVRKRQWTPERRAAAGEMMRARWAAGFQRKRVAHWDVWRPEHDAALRALAGSMPIGELTEELTRRFGVPRTLASLRMRAQRIGQSLWMLALSMRDVATLFGFDPRAIKRNWIATGYLEGSRWSGRGGNPGWWFSERQVERFIREYQGRYDVARMPTRHANAAVVRLASLARTLERGDPWRTSDDLAAYLGLANGGSLKAWIRKGMVPLRHQPKSGKGQRIMIRGRDFVAIKAAIDGWRAEQRVLTADRMREFRARRRAA